MIKHETINLKPLKFVCLFLIIIGFCLYFNNLNPPSGTFRSYFLLGYTILFLIFGISFSNYEYAGYKRYFFERALKFLVYSAAYSLFCGNVILISILSSNTVYRFPANVLNTINTAKFLFANFWFIPTGLIILFTLPFLDKILKKYNHSIVLFMSIALVMVLNEVIAPLIQNNGLHLRDIFASLRYVLFYGFITLIGLSHSKLKENKKKNKVITITFIITTLILIAACLVIYGYNYDLIKHFYPPTFFLLIYHLFILSIFYCLSSKLISVLNFLNKKKLVQYTSDYLTGIVFVLPVFLYLTSLLFDTLKITDFLDEYFIVGFLTYLLCAFFILITTFLVINLLKAKKTKRTQNLVRI